MANFAQWYVNTSEAVAIICHSEYHSKTSNDNYESNLKKACLYYVIIVIIAKTVII